MGDWRDRQAAASVADELSLLDQLRATLGRKLGNAEDAADITQECYARLAARNGPRVHNTAGYLRRIAHNLIVDRHRRPATVEIEPIAEFIACDAPSAERVMIARERLRAVLAVADRLPVRCREVFLLRKIDDLEQQEIAARLGISLNMVQKHLRKALFEISAALGKDF